jgi:hypothetical protein
LRFIQFSDQCLHADAIDAKGMPGGGLACALVNLLGQLAGQALIVGDNPDARGR